MKNRIFISEAGLDFAPYLHLVLYQIISPV